MSSPEIWSQGRYDAVGDRIAPIAEQVVDAVAARVSLRGAEVVDLACGTGSAALAAAERGARVTGVDLTPELLTIAARRDPDQTVSWCCADASDTGLPGGRFDAAVSNMGIIFVEPARQLAEASRLLKPAGVLCFSAWIREPDNPFSAPIIEVLGRPQAPPFSPDQWGDEEIATDRLAPYFDDIAVIRGTHTWRLGSMAEALRFVREESPMHVETFRRADPDQRQRLTAAFESALRPHLDSSATVTFASPFVVVSASRRG